MAGRIFINYRRKLNVLHARLLYEALQRHFPRRQLFIDLDGLDAVVSGQSSNRFNCLSISRPLIDGD